MHCPHTLVVISLSSQRCHANAIVHGYVVVIQQQSYRCCDALTALHRRHSYSMNWFLSYRDRHGAFGVTSTSMLIRHSVVIKASPFNHDYVIVIIPLSPLRHR